MSHPDEVFIQFRKAVKPNPNLFDQNRIAASVSPGPVRNFKATFSYGYGYQERNPGKEFNHVNCYWAIRSFEHLFSQLRYSNSRRGIAGIDGEGFFQ